MRVARAHTDSNGQRWEIGDDAENHPDVKERPWLFEGYRPRKKAEKAED